LPLRKIKKYAIHLDWNIAFDGKSKGNKHLFRVVRIATFLARKEGGNLQIIQAGAWLHDIGLIEGNKNHDKRGVRIAKKFLSKLKIEKRIVREILHCIECHEGNIKPKSREAMIVHDADALDKLGPLGILRHTWKLANSGMYVEQISRILEKELERRKRRLYTTTAKRLANELSKNQKQFFRLLKKQLSLEYLKEDL